MLDRADVADVKCHYRRDGAMYRVVELKRANGNVIVEQKARPSNGRKNVSWTNKNKLGKVAQGDIL